MLSITSNIWHCQFNIPETLGNEAFHNSVMAAWNDATHYYFIIAILSEPQKPQDPRGAEHLKHYQGTALHCDAFLLSFPLFLDRWSNQQFMVSLDFWVNCWRVFIIIFESFYNENLLLLDMSALALSDNNHPTKSSRCNLHSSALKWHCGRKWRII